MDSDDFQTALEKRANKLHEDAVKEALNSLDTSKIEDKIEKLIQERDSITVKNLEDGDLANRRSEIEKNYENQRDEAIQEKLKKFRETDAGKKYESKCRRIARRSPDKLMSQEEQVEELMQAHCSELIEDKLTKISLLEIAELKKLREEVHNNPQQYIGAHNARIKELNEQIEKQRDQKNQMIDARKACYESDEANAFFLFQAMQDVSKRFDIAIDITGFEQE